MNAMRLVAACTHCQGRGYRTDHRRETEPMASVEIGKVLAYDCTLGIARILLEETLHQGDRLIAIFQGLATDFEVRTMLVAGMNLQIALRGWEVNIFVPQVLQPGTWIMRKEH
jgi:hypothetical protein